MRRFIYFTLLSISLLLFITSCGGAKNKDQSTETLTIGVMSSMDYLPLAVAQREGYFKEVGLDLNIQKFYSANDRDAAFQSANIDGTVIDFTGAILQKSGGIDVKITSQCDAPFYIVAASKSGINNIIDLKGKQVAISQNTVIDFIVDMALQSVDLTDADIKKVEINKIPLRFEMLQNNKVDATGLPNPFALMAKTSGDKILTSNDSLGFAITGIMFHQESIYKKAKQIEQMYDAYNMGVEYLEKHTANDVKDILIKDLGFPKDLIDKVELPKYSKAKLPRETDIEVTVDWLMGKGLVNNGFKPKSILDSQFVEGK